MLSIRHCWICNGRLLALLRAAIRAGTTCSRYETERGPCIFSHDRAAEQHRQLGERLQVEKAPRGRAQVAAAIEESGAALLQVREGGSFERSRETRFDKPPFLARQAIDHLKQLSQLGASLQGPDLPDLAVAARMTLLQQQAAVGVAGGIPTAVLVQQQQQQQQQLMTAMQQQAQGGPNVSG